MTRLAWIAALGLALCLPSGSGAAPTLLYERNLTGDPPLTRPVAITFDPETGGFCVTDEGSATIDVFDERGLHRFRTDRKSAISTPKDGCLDAQGGFVFTDAAGPGKRTIRRLNFLGEPLPYEPEPPRQMWIPRGLLVTADGNYLTVDRSGVLAKHDAATGALMWARELADPEWERSDLLGRPAEAKDGRIYVPSSGTGVVLVVSPDGERIGSFGTPGVKFGELAFPVGITFGPGGEMLVLDQMKHTVVIFDPERKPLAEFGRVGRRPGDFYNPLAISSSPDGRVYISQGLEGRIQVFRLVDRPAE